MKLWLQNSANPDTSIFLQILHDIVPENLFLSTKSCVALPALQAADLDWIVGPG